MLKTNSKKAKENIKNYILNNYDESYYIDGDPRKEAQAKKIKDLESQLTQYRKKEEEARQKEWRVRTPEAVAELERVLTKAYGKSYKNIEIDNIDACGYWFLYTLQQDKTKQKYCIRHTDLRG